MDYLEGGHSLREFLDQFPTITREMAVQALEEAKDWMAVYRGGGTPATRGLVGTRAEEGIIPAQS